MKQADVLKLLKNIQTNPGLKKKVKIFVAVAFVGVLLAGGLVIWAGVTALNYMASSAEQIIKSPAAQAQVESLKSELGEVPKVQFQALSCWETAQTLLAVEPWLTKSLEAHLLSLKAACFGAPKKETCEGEGCTQAEI